MGVSGMNTLQRRLLLLFFLVGIVPFMLIVVCSSVKSRVYFKEQQLRHLEQLADVKNAALHSHYQLLLRNAEAMARMPALVAFLETYHQTGDRVLDDQYAPYRQVYQALQAYQESHWGVFHHVFLADPGGRVIVSPLHLATRTNHQGTSVREVPYFRQALKESRFTDYFGFQESDHYHQLLMQPVFNPAGQALGVLVFEVEIEEILNFLNQDVQKVKGEGVFLTTLSGYRITRDKQAFRQQVHSSGISQALSRGKAVGFFRNAEGQEVVGVYLRDATYPYVLAVEMDKQSVFASVNRHFWVIFLLSFLAIGGIGIALGFAGKRMAEPLIEMTHVAKRITEGDLKHRIRINSTTREIVDLSNAINHMVDTLEESREALQRQKESVEKEVEKAVKRAEEEKAYLNQSFATLLDAMDRFAGGDLTVQLKAHGRDEIARLFAGFNRVVQIFRTIILELNEMVMATLQVSENIRLSTERLAVGASEQASQAGEVSAAVEEMAQTILENSRNANQTTKLAGENGQVAQEGRKVVDQTVEKIREIADVVRQSARTVEQLGQSSSKIGEIVSVINDIAEQTNLLALNAAIEAARAGDQGKGFAVVADEVRKLAERTTQATRQIATMIEAIQTETDAAVQAMQKGNKVVDEGIQYADQAGQALEKIVNSAQDVVNMIQHIAAASREQTSASEQISRGIETIAAVSSESANSIAQIVEIADHLKQLTEKLRNRIRNFKMDGANKWLERDIPGSSVATASATQRPENPDVVIPERPQNGSNGKGE